MTEQQPEQNKVLIEVAKKIGLDPKQITTLQVMGDGSGVVTITFEGVERMDEQEFQKILEEHGGQDG